jgi:dienelactone hydrolase
LPPEQADRIRDAFASHADAEMHSHAGAGHAFDNYRAPIFYHQPAADASWPQTTAFLKRTYPVAA